MWQLIAMTCVMLKCNDSEIIAVFKTKEECEVAMIEEFKKDEKGKALMCLEKPAIET